MEYFSDRPLITPADKLWETAANLFKSHAFLCDIDTSELEPNHIIHGPDITTIATLTSTPSPTGQELVLQRYLDGPTGTDTIVIRHVEERNNPQLYIVRRERNDIGAYLSGAVEQALLTSLDQEIATATWRDTPQKANVEPQA